MIRRSSRLGLALVATLALALSPGYATWSDAQDRGRLRPFGGVRALCTTVDTFPVLLPFLFVDGPFSLAADLLTFPLALVSELREARAARHELREQTALPLQEVAPPRTRCCAFRW